MIESLPLPSPTLAATTRHKTSYVATRRSVVLVGDSTVCDQPHDSSYRGWGQFLPHLLGDKFQITNRAKSGASTKTFIEEGLWEEVLALKPDWVLIQMGHNDSHAPEKPESTRADGEYATNLRRFIADLRFVAAAPVLITPVRRFRFDSKGRLVEDDSALKPYAEVVRAIGQQLKVPIVDLFASSTHFFECLGQEGSDRLSPAPGEDFTHFNEVGARAVAALVAEELALAAPELGLLPVRQDARLLTASPYLV